MADTDLIERATKAIDMFDAICDIHDPSVSAHDRRVRAMAKVLEAAPSPSPAPGVVTDEMVEAAARAIDPDAFAEYERRLQYNAHKEPESERRKFADYYDTRPAAIETARAALESALASLSQPAKGEREGGE